ncbi:MAG TPA: CBS domain-containing protein [Patescibacteria group bacterium]|nr:CBS domain-containing protein [Patescibacteria group bacterium]
MTSPVISVTVDTPLAQAADFMIRKNITGLPVIDDQNHVIGIITEHDFLTRDEYIHIPSYLNFLKEFSQDKLGRAKEEVTKIQNLTVGDLMTHPVVTLSPDDQVARAAEIMAQKKINPLPIVDASGCLVGIISRSDIVKLFVNKK